jgi:hypothetical protein
MVLLTWEIEPAWHEVFFLSIPAVAIFPGGKIDRSPTSFQ